MIALPLETSDGENLGVLDIYASESDAFGKEEQSLLEELAGDLSYGIRSLRTAQEHRSNEMLLNAIIENLPVGLQIFDDKGYSFLVNRKQKELLGLPHQNEGIGTFNILTDPYSKSNGSDKLFRRAYQGEVVQTDSEFNFGVPGNKWNTRKDKRFFNETIFPIYGNQERIEYVVSLLSDITELKKSEEKYRELFEKAPVGIFLTNSKGQILELNPALAEIIGASSSDEVRKKIKNLGTDLYARKDRRTEFISHLEKNSRVNNFVIEAFDLRGNLRRLSLDAQVQSKEDDGTLIISGFTTPL
jgi:PAS domain S-box-containing protein